MQTKPFQDGVLRTLDIYLDALHLQRAKSFATSEFIRQHPELELPEPNFPEKAWSQLLLKEQLPRTRPRHPYTSRTDGTGQPIPNICLKIPTGGGKTFLGAHALSHILGRYTESNHGFVLWIIPNEAIYTQTKRQLTNRESPIRQILDRAAAGRVKILEKDDPLNRLDVESNLCIMLLMLQSANRETKETLRLFRDRGSIHGFFPPEDDVLAHTALAAQIPNLDRYLRVETAETTIKDSLGNVLRFIRPIVLIDEGHKGYSEGALNTINGFNPSFVLELSATPKPSANWLVDVRGADLKAAEMIKIPINAIIKPSDDWKDCLRASLEKLNELQTTADSLRDSTNRYIRPILLVQAERTGKDTRDGIKIHAEDIRDYLLALGFDRPQIAVKSADTNELDTPENANLLANTCPVRVIITKQALQEGWDCPFAYVLCTLATNRNLNSLTQLVGRILRQPETSYVPEEFSALNESYVFCHSAKTKDVTDQIKKGLEEDGLNDLTGSVTTDDGTSRPPAKRMLQRRDKFRTLNIFLPLVNWVEPDGARPLDYEQDILYRIDWSQLKMQPLVERLVNPASPEATWIARLELGESPTRDWLMTSREQLIETRTFDTVYATRVMVDIVPNPWVAREILGNLLTSLKQLGLINDAIDGMASLILEELKKQLAAERDRLAEAVFHREVAAERIQFRLRADCSHWRMPQELPTSLPENARKAARERSGNAIEKSIFAPVYDADFDSTPEREFACYLDEEAALQWWHRNVAKTGYGIQGWKRDRMYPDFLFAYQLSDNKHRIAVWETKGEHLSGNLDTEYKRKLLNTITKAFKFETATYAGELALVAEDGTTIECEMILTEDWKTPLRTRLNALK
jgi:type III restriction enzyme